MMQSYAEVSPSGRGMRILFLATGFEFDKARYYINNQKIGLEVYVAGATSKFVTVTGHALFPGEDLNERGPQLQAVLEKYIVSKAVGLCEKTVRRHLRTLSNAGVVQMECHGSNFSYSLRPIWGKVREHRDLFSECEGGQSA